MLEKGVGHVVLNTFMDPAVVAAFDEALPVLKSCSGLILDLRKNMGGSSYCANSIAAHFLRQPTETCVVRSRKNIAVHRAHAVNTKSNPPEKLVDLSDPERENYWCYRNQCFQEESWGQIQPAAEILSLPVAILTSSETNSAADDFLMAFQSGKGEGIRIGESTSGSSGQPLEITLPGGGLGAICTVRMPEPENVWQKGIEPDIRVAQTVEDIIHDRDPVLAAALRYLCDK
jgi:C-terminal processing protease CtpA/Prc